MHAVRGQKKISHILPQTRLSPDGGTDSGRVSHPAHAMHLISHQSPGRVSSVQCLSVKRTVSHGPGGRRPQVLLAHGAVPGANGLAQSSAVGVTGSCRLVRPRRPDDDEPSVCLGSCLVAPCFATWCPGALGTGSAGGRWVALRRAPSVRGD